MLEISILINKQINQMTTEIMTLNEFIADVAGHKLIKYVEYRYNNMYTEDEIDEEMDKYYAGDYEIHLHYLIETWKISVDEDIYNNFKIDYNRRGTFDELWKYFVGLHCPMFGHEWLDDIFERHILVTSAVSLK